MNIFQDFHSRGAVNHRNVNCGYFSRPDMATESQMGMGDGFKRTLSSITYTMIAVDRCRALPPSGPLG